MFSIRGLVEALFPPRWSPGSRRLSRFVCARMWGRRVCQWSDCLPRSSHTPPVSVPPRQRESSPPRCPSPPLLLVWMNVYFLFPWCRTSWPFDFLSLLVRRGGAVCLPTLPSWFSVCPICKSVYLGLCPFLNWIGFFLVLSFRNSL